VRYYISPLELNILFEMEYSPHFIGLFETRTLRFHRAFQKPHNDIRGYNVGNVIFLWVSLIITYSQSIYIVVNGV
jgi:hypothetical protein